MVPEYKIVTLRLRKITLESSSVSYLLLHLECGSLLHITNSCKRPCQTQTQMPNVTYMPYIQYIYIYITLGVHASVL